MDAELAEQVLALASAPAQHRRYLRSLGSRELLLTHAKRADTPIAPSHVRHFQDWMRQPDCCYITIRDKTYPELLRQIDDPPLVLFVSGNAKLLQAPQVAIIGSRMASPIGLHTADYFARGLSQAGVVVSSGLATGIDGAAHRGALQQGTTLAVLANGTDVYYPPRHRQLQQQIRQAGVLVSELPPGMPPKRGLFPRRNRILSGLSSLVLIIEAKMRSGTMSTAALANAQNKDVWVVPGSIWDVAFSGSFKLLKEGAGLATSVDDILQELNLAPLPPSDGITASAQINSSRSLANDQLLANVGLEVTSVDTIVARSGLPIAIVTEQLVMLELEGLVTSVPGGYIRMGRR